MREYTCNICKRKLEYTKRELVSKVVRNMHYDYLISAYKYKSIIRKLLLDFKFEDKKYLVDFLSLELTKLIQQYHIFDNIDYILYVPISLKRFYERGYNQSYLIANRISKELGIPIIKYGLIKIKNNKRQSELNHIDRVLNAKDVYRVNKLYDFEEKNIVLIDDIFTTGSTVNECSRILKECGVKKIIVATVAIA